MSECMTPEQIAAHCLLGAGFKTAEAADDALKAIATALLTARNEALEEIEKFVSGNKWKLAGDIKTLGHNEACDEILEHIRALKHKDGQP